MAKTEQYSPLPPWPRTDYCGAIRATDAGREVALWGWVQTRRDHGGLIFVDLRDREGIVQLVFNPEHDAAAHEVAGGALGVLSSRSRARWCAAPKAPSTPSFRPAKSRCVVSACEILNASAPPPFPIGDADATAEEVRLQAIATSICAAPRCSATCAGAIRRCRRCATISTSTGFIEVETPILFKSTPEGARDYLVPSRVNPGQVLRAAAIAAAVEAVPDGRRIRSLLSRSRDAFATRICARIASPSSARSISR